MSKLRLKYAEPKPIVMQSDIRAALNDWRSINSDNHKWATFHARQFLNTRIVRVEWGVIHSNGYREIAIQTLHYTLMKDGRVAVTRTTHG